MNSSPGKAAESSMNVSEHEFELARKLHRSLLPTRIRNELADVAASCREFDLLGGDYCTAYWQTARRLFLCVCDVSGHGIAAALLAARINTFVRLEIEHAHARHPCEVVEHLNQFLWTHFQGTTVYATFFCAVVDWDKNQVEFAGAGHPPALLRKSGGEIQRLESASPMLGITKAFSAPCQVGATPFGPGDVLWLYTDGILEAKGQEDRYFELEGIESTLREMPETIDAMELVDHLLGALDNFVSEDGITDDVLALCASLSLDVLGGQLEQLK